MITSSQGRVRLAAEVRHQAVLLARDPGPLIGYTVMPLLLITVLRPMYGTLAHLASNADSSGTDQAAAGMAVMFSLFALKVVGASMLNERTWNTWDRLRASPAGSGEILLGKAIPMYGAILAQQTILFGFAAIVFGLRPESGWWTLAACIAAWSACVLLLGTAASTLARSPAQLSAAGDVLAIVTTILAGALVPGALLPQWLQHLAPISPGYWAIHAYKAALLDHGGSLARPLAILAAFGAIGVVQGIIIDRHREA